MKFHEFVKLCLFCFSCNYYGDSLNVMFPRFPNHLLPFLMGSPYVFSSASVAS